MRRSLCLALLVLWPVACWTLQLRAAHTHNSSEDATSEAPRQLCLLNAPYVAARYHPYWMCYLKRSVEANPGLEFHYITNLDPPDCGTAPSSSRRGGKFLHHRLNLTHLGRRAQRALNFSAKEAKHLVKHVQNYPYGNTDLKPALGLLYEDLLIGCQYWGWADVDIVLGNISLLNLDSGAYDVLNPYAPQYGSAGPLMIMRNTHRSRHLFSHAGDWKKSFLDKNCDKFDEDFMREHTKGISKALSNAHGLRKMPDGSVFGECQCDVFDSRFWPRCLPPGDDPGKRGSDPGRLATWSGGKLQVQTGFGKIDEHVFFHFMTWKRNATLFRVPPSIASDCFQVRDTGFSEC